MMTISLCMIVRNEEDVLARCLRSACKLVDEIIIVDTGSTDRTKEIARTYTDKVYDFEWIDDFAAARNHAFLQATMDYCMWLDADDVIEGADLEGFLTLKRTLPPDVDCVMMRYHAAFDQKGRPTFSYYRERIVRNLKQPVWIGAVHEVITPFGRVIHSDIAVCHRKNRPGDPDRNLRIFEAQIEKGAALDPRGQFYYARELVYHDRFEEAAKALERYLEEGGGWVENVIEACRFLSICCYQLGREGDAVRALFSSFVFDTPRAEVLCDLGKHFLDRGAYHQAIFWYELALTRERNDRSGAFVLPDCYDFLPCLQLAVLHDRIGDYKRANDYNERAAAYKPDSPAVLHNRGYFAKKLAT